MQRCQILAIFVGSVIAALSGAPGSSRAVSANKTKEKYIPLDLKPKANHLLKDNFHDGAFKGNNLEPLPRGARKFGAVKFLIAEGMIQLGSTEIKDKPVRVEGIEVDQVLTRLHILHATGFQAPENTVIANYVVHYADKTKATIEVVYGKDVRDWWDSEDPNDVSRGKCVWKAQNQAVKSLSRPNIQIRLFLTTWENPYPRKKVTHIDYAATMADKIKASPFCVAMTAENK